MSKTYITANIKTNTNSFYANNKNTLEEKIKVSHEHEWCSFTKVPIPLRSIGTCTGIVSKSNALYHYIPYKILTILTAVKVSFIMDCPGC